MILKSHLESADKAHLQVLFSLSPFSFGPLEGDQIIGAGCALHERRASVLLPNVSFALEVREQIHSLAGGGVGVGAKGEG